MRTLTVIAERIDEMGSRVDELEKSLGDLVKQVGNHAIAFVALVNWSYQLTVAQADSDGS